MADGDVAVASTAADAVEVAVDDSAGVASDGEFVVLWGSYTQISGVVLTSGAITNNRFGSFHHDDMIGKSYGTKVRARKGGAWLALLRSTPEFITQSLTHRTQIIYHADISLVLSLLDVQPGRVVCEAGTGSGSMSSSLARALRPGGKLYTFEFHEDRQRQAQADFERYGLQDTIVSQHGDVCINGFGAELEGVGGRVDGIFLDLPMPWLAVPHADKCLKPAGRIVTFSPCIEQIDKTAAELRKGGRYYNVRMFETLAMNWGVRDQGQPRKRQRSSAGAVASAPADDAGDAEAGEAEAGGAAPQQGAAAGAAPQERWLSYPMQMRSHTGYLLYAIRAPPEDTSAAPAA